MDQSGRWKTNTSRPTAPPVYRPQPVPKVLQQKTAPGQKIVATAAKAPVAPPVFRPQPAPKVLQQKAVSVAPAFSASRPTPVAPAAYRPNPAPKVLQAKMVAQTVNCAQSSPAPLAGLSPRLGAIQLSKGGKGGGKSGKSKAPQKTKSGNLTKKAQQKAQEKQERAEAKAKAKQEQQNEREWQEKRRLGQKKEMAALWETDKEFFSRYQKGSSVRPANTVAPRYAIPVIDLDDIREDNPHLALLIEDSLAKIQVRPNTPEHGNREGKLPGYNPLICPMAYLEYSFLGGGGRLVVDAINGIVYICAHYSYYYQLTVGGHAPQDPVTAAASQRTITLEFLNVEEQEPLVMHTPPESAFASSSSSSSVSMVSPRRRSMSPPPRRRSMSPSPRREAPELPDSSPPQHLVLRLRGG